MFGASFRALRGHTPQLGGDSQPLDRIINKALEKDRNLRYQSAAEMRTDLQRLKRESDRGRSSGSAPAITAPASRRRTVVWSIALIALILLGTVAWFEIASRNAAVPLRILEYTQLTHNGHAGLVMGTDGSRLYMQPNLGCPQRLPPLGARSSRFPRSECRIRSWLTSRLTAQRFSLSPTRKAFQHRRRCTAFRSWEARIVTWLTE